MYVYQFTGKKQFRQQISEETPTEILNNDQGTKYAYTNSLRRVVNVFAVLSAIDVKWTAKGKLSVVRMKDYFSTNK